MSSDDEDLLCRFGTPLDPIAEDAIPSKKPITIADQIAVDSNGRRRFHGAFTGGFSAGFWNTVGSQEGWKPQEFKSSRSEKAKQLLQKPNDFMDEEDMGEFGIAPQRIQATDDFTPTTDNQRQQRNKRKLAAPHEGPIPGVPVLQLVLESCHDKAAVRLLKQMDGKYDRMSSKKERKSTKQQNTTMTSDSKEEETEEAEDISPEEMANQRRYMCDMGPIQRIQSTGDTDDDVDDDENDDDYDNIDMVFDEDEFDAFVGSVKNDRFGLDYVGLDKGDFFSNVGNDAPTQSKHFSLFPSFQMIDQNNKKLSIKGQAFGVGAFEEDDDDIYAKDDMSRYDFTLGNKSGENKNQKKAIKGASHFIDGFMAAEKMRTEKPAHKRIFVVSIPPSFEPRNWLKRRTRFGPEIPSSTSTANSSIKKPAAKIVGRHDLTPMQRGEILNEKSASKSAADDKTENIDSVDSLLKAAGLKSLDFVTEIVECKSSDIAAEHGNSNESKNLPTSVASNVVSKLDLRASENMTNASTAPECVPQIFDRFVTENVAIENEPKAEPVVSTTVKLELKIIRTKTVWKACQMLCYKMNVESAVSAKPNSKANSFSLFNCLMAGNESSKKKPLQFTNTGAFLQDDENEQAKQKQIERDAEQKSRRNDAAMLNIPSTRTSEREPLHENVTTVNISQPVKLDKSKKSELELKIIDAIDKHPSQKKDIFKSIFGSSDSEDDEENKETSLTSNDTLAVGTNETSKDAMVELLKPSTLTTNYPQLPDEIFMPKLAKDINILRNTSPPRGIFSGIVKKPDLKSLDCAKQANSSSKEINKTHVDNSTSSDCYGPLLPPTINRKVSTEKLPVQQSISSNSSNSVASLAMGSGSQYKIYLKEQWIEKTDDKKSKKTKKVKKEKKDRHKHKSKKSKKEKHKSHSVREKSSKR